MKLSSKFNNALAVTSGKSELRDEILNTFKSHIESFISSEDTDFVFATFKDGSVSVITQEKGVFSFDSVEEFFLMLDSLINTDEKEIEALSQKILKRLK